MWLFYLRQYLLTSLWFIPALFLTGAVGLAVVLDAVDANVKSGWIERVTFQGDPDNARSVLTTIAASMITFTGLVFTITIVVLQLASQQFSPRVLRTFLRDRQSQVALGTFVATFAYAIVVLRNMPARDAPDAVPQISITVALLFVLVSLGVFVSYIHRISQSIRVAKIIESIKAETRSAIDRIYDDATEQPPIAAPSRQPNRTLVARHAGVVTVLDRDALAKAARKADCALEVVPSIGDFVPEGGPVMRVYGGDSPDERILRHVALGPERTMEQDPAFGFRQLVDIAERALSPAVNDPTTAVQSLDAMHDLLRALIGRPFPAGGVVDDEGKVRLVFPVMTWEGYVSLACDELRQYGERSLQVMRRMRSMLDDLLAVGPPDRRKALEREVRLLEAAVARNWPDRDDRRAGLTRDEQGLGD